MQVSGCMVFLGGVGQFAHKAAFGMAAMCGNGNATITQPVGTDMVPNFTPRSHVSVLNTDDFQEGQPGIASPQTPSQADAAFEPVYATASRVSVLSAQSGTTAASIGVGDTHGANEDNPDTPDDKDVLAKKLRNLSQQDLLSRGGLTVSGGYSSVEGPNAGIRIARSNIGGFGRELSASARYSKIQKLVEFGYADNSFLGTSMIFAPTVFANRQSAKGFGSGLQSTPFRQSAYGINFNVIRKFDSGLSASANYRLSSDSFQLAGNNRICDSGIFGSPICSAIGKSTSSILSFALTLDRRDNAINPTHGFKLRLTQDLAGLGGNTRYTRTRLGGSVYIGIADDWNLSIGAEGGFISAIGSRVVPPFERFYIGGSTMRGFDLRSIGPKIRPTAAAPGQNVAIGGRAYYAVRAELSLPVGGAFEKFGIRPCAFVDAGSVFGALNSGLLPGETLIGNSAKPRVALGLGLALNTPAGKFRLDFAKPVIKQSGDRPRMLSFSFGAAL
jgi:outer membrane protein assembly complex protein YaeT